MQLSSCLSKKPLGLPFLGDVLCCLGNTGHTDLFEGREGFKRPTEKGLLNKNYSKVCFILTWRSGL